MTQTWYCLFFRDAIYRCNTKNFSWKMMVPRLGWFHRPIFNISLYRPRFSLRFKISCTGERIHKYSLWDRSRSSFTYFMLKGSILPLPSPIPRVTRQPDRKCGKYINIFCPSLFAHFYCVPILSCDSFETKVVTVQTIPPTPHPQTQ